LKAIPAKLGFSFWSRPKTRSNFKTSFSCL